MLYNGVEIYQAKIEDELDGIYTISLVDYPAVERNFVCFKQVKQQVRFAVDSEEKHNITGVVMLADVPIYRRNGDYEYYITYSKETIEKMANKLLKDGLQNQVSLQHDGNNITGITMQELYIKDSSKGINPNFIEDIPDGSLMATFHVEDSQLWDDIKNGDMLNGFSLEGFFSIEKMAKNNKINKNKNMSKIAKFVKSLMKFGELSTDKGTIYWNGEDAIAVGVEVYIDGEDEEKVIAADGEYVLEDGKVIVVVEGKVSEIREPASEEVIVEESLRKNRFNKVKAAFEESYEEKERKIIEAIRSIGFSDSWLVEAGEDYAVVENWNDEIGDYKTVRFSISWDEEGNVIVGEFEEVKSAFVPVEEDVPAVSEEVREDSVEQFEEETPVEEVVVEPDSRDEKDEKISALEEEVNALKVEIENIKSQLAQIISEPASEPIQEEFEAVAKEDNKTSIFSTLKAAKKRARL